MACDFEIGGVKALRVFGIPAKYFLREFFDESLRRIKIEWKNDSCPDFSGAGLK